MDGSPPGSPITGILQARTLEWVAISFSNAWKWKVKVKLFSCVWLFETPWTAAYQAPLSMGFSGQEYWSGLPLPSLFPYLHGGNYSVWLRMLLHPSKIIMTIHFPCEVPCFCQGWLSIPLIYLWHRTTRKCHLLFLQGKECCIFLLGCRYKHLSISRAYPDLGLANQPILLCLLKLVMYGKFIIIVHCIFCFSYYLLTV